MPILARKQKRPQQAPSSDSARPARSRSGETRDVPAARMLQHALGNQAVQRIMASGTGSARPGAGASEHSAQGVGTQAVQASPAGARIPGSGTGRPLESGTREEMGRRFGSDLSDVRVHTDTSAAHLNQNLNARAFTSGSDIFFNREEYNPHSTEGKRLLAHELTHVLQQRGQTPRSRGQLARGVQRKPDYLVTMNFIGSSVEVNPTMRDRLQDVEADLQAQYDALGPDSAERTHAGGDPMSFREWAGVRSARAWRSGSSTSKHASGSAIDVNYDLQPYIATRTIRPKADGTTETIYGGEAAGAALQDERRRAVEVYDRAMDFTTEGTTADVGERATGESTTSVYNRFYSVDYALRRYFGTVFLTTPTQVDRQPIADIEGATEAELLAAIPTTERKEEADAIQTLESYMHTGFSTSRASWPLTPRQQFFRILRDYEHVRIPMVRGNPAARPASTRNPARGFLDMSRKFVVAMVDVGRMRWGIADFGAHSSGDVHHFDLGNHGGYTPDGTP